MQILNFTLDSDDMDKLRGLDQGESARTCFGMPGSVQIFLSSLITNYPKY